jgi:hypothetical protein
MSYALWLFLGAALAAPEPSMSELTAQLSEIARVASVMVDGDACRRIQTPRSAEFMMKQDPRDPYLASDNYDVDHTAFISTKKTLIRLSKLTRYPCDVNLWMPIPTDPPRVQIVIRNVHEMSQFWEWGALHQAMFTEMRQVLDSGEQVVVSRRTGMVSVLAPVKDSLGDIVGLVEVVGRTAEDPTENVK